jgi:GH15 family glucan-1,4-alpha-glucosidase
VVKEQDTVAAKIADYALLSDCQGSALVDRAGSIDWACLPRFDSASVFARLLDPAGGHWRIGPVDEADVSRSYLEDTMVLQTVFSTPSGTVALTDAMAFGRDEVGHHIGHHSPHLIIRRLEGLVGEVDCEVDLTMRCEYGLTRPSWESVGEGFRSRGGPHTAAVWSEARLGIEGSDVHGTVRIRAGDVVHFGLQIASTWGEPSPMLTGEDLRELLARTISGWQSWSELHQSYTGRHAELVRSSGRVLQALTYAPTGAIVAAPTTSLPETTGGSRNWDYRYCWIRDASLTLEALWVAACPQEAGTFFRFLATAAGGWQAQADQLQILYGIRGERLLPEYELDHLAGFANSAPVRVGNGAWQQVQLDTYGELLSAASILSEQIGAFDARTSALLTGAADVAATRWSEPDQGIWELRGEPRHFLHSKLMCWVGLDRAIQLAAKLGAESRIPSWEQSRDAVRAAIERDGWNEDVGAYTQAFGSTALDASSLLLGTVGFLERDDPRLRSTVEAIADRLTDERGLVYRYLGDDGLQGEEGTFTICSFWLVRALAHLGELERAESLFEQIVGFANDLGLLAEEIDGATGDQLGNFPQAFTHIGLVSAAWDLEQGWVRRRDLEA